MLYVEGDGSVLRVFSHLCDTRLCGENPRRVRSSSDDQEGSSYIQLVFEETYIPKKVIGARIVY